MGDVTAAGTGSRAVRALCSKIHIGETGRYDKGSAWWEVRGDTEPRRAAAPGSGAALS